MNVPNLALYLLQDPSFVTVEKQTPLGDLELIWIIFSALAAEGDVITSRENHGAVQWCLHAICSYVNTLIATCAIGKCL